MILAPGPRLGPYEVTGKLGEGGMGEVWRARDTKLGREAAIKVLPPGFAADTERLTRGPSRVDEALGLKHEKGIAIITSNHGEEWDSSLLCS